METKFQPNTQRRIQIALLLSVALHAVFTLFLALNSPSQPHVPTNIEVNFVTEPQQPAVAQQEPAKEQQIVEQDEKALNDEKKPDTKYLSAHNQVVKKQTVAVNKGEFKNAGKQQNINGQEGAPRKMDLQKFVPQLDVSKSIKDRQEREMEYEKNAELEANKKQKDQERKVASASQGQKMQKVGAAGSASMDYIKDLDPGMETLLSTREFVFYTYYARIRKQLNQYWGPSVREKISQIYRQGRKIASDEDKITRCLILLDKRGNLLKIQIIGQSGIQELDQAAADSFRSAAPFPNPPQGIVDNDGYIRIRWDFILEA